MMFAVFCLLFFVYFSLTAKIFKVTCMYCLSSIVDKKTLLYIPKKIIFDITSKSLYHRYFIIILNKKRTINKMTFFSQTMKNWNTCYRTTRSKTAQKLTFLKSNSRQTNGIYRVQIQQDNSWSNGLKWRTIFSCYIPQLITLVLEDTLNRKTHQPTIF